jgi:PGF-pre-PGF domain-containing protein
MSFTISSDEKKSFSCYYRLKKYGICILALSLLVLGSAIVSAEAESLQFNEVEDQIVTAGDEVSFTVSAVSPTSDQITYGIEDLPSGASIDDNTGYFNWLTSPDDSDNRTLEFFATDGNSTVTQFVTIYFIAPVHENNPPILPPVDPQYVDENSFLTFTLSGNDPDEDEITYSSSPLPAGARLDSSTGIFEWTPATGQAGIYSITFTVSDGALSESTTATITVSKVNSGTDATPKITTITAKTVEVKNTLQFTVKASGGNGTLIFSASKLPSGATFDNATQVFKWTPSTSQVGMHSAIFKVTDGENSDEETVSIIVKEASDSSGGSGGSSSGGSSSGSGGSSQASSEKYENIEFKDYSIKYVLKDVDNVFSFKRENNSIQSVIIRTRLNQGETKTMVEILKGTSSMANKEAPGIVYRNLNIWVGDEKFSSSNLIEAKVEFMVEKAWLTENSVDPASIKLLRYSKSWGYLPTSIKSQDKTYVYYTAKVPEFSVFAISSVDESAFAEDGEGNQSNDDENISRSVDDSEGLNGTAPITPEKKSSWLILFVLVGMAGVGTVGYMYREKVSEMIFKLGNSDGKSYRRSRR